MGDGKFCLERVSEGSNKLKRNHAYYYQVTGVTVYITPCIFYKKNNPHLQVQAQLLCTKFKYCDFIVYTKEDIHVERIELDLSFIDENLPKVKTVFENSILPELLGR